MNKIDRYKRAGEIARHAMGKDRRGDSEAVNDPLAWWCLTEWIANAPSKEEMRPPLDADGRGLTAPPRNAG